VRGTDRVTDRQPDRDGVTERGWTRARVRVYEREKD